MFFSLQIAVPIFFDPLRVLSIFHSFPVPSNHSQVHPTTYFLIFPTLFFASDFLFNILFVSPLLFSFYIHINLSLWLVNKITSYERPSYSSSVYFLVIVYDHNFFNILSSLGNFNILKWLNCNDRYFEKKGLFTKRHGVI